jgi:hypothetical protein
VRDCHARLRTRAAHGRDGPHSQESAIIVWDAGTKTQHFIRRANFRTKAAQVGGYDAVVLEATQAEALNDWLKQHGYASSPELVEWFKPYIAKKWRITAFKIIRDGADEAEAKAVRMSFKADTPFFPYREPAQPAASGSGRRELRVFFVSDSRAEGTIGSHGSWPGKTLWADQVGSADRDTLYKSLKIVPPAGDTQWLTEFFDDSSPRPATDEVFFKASKDVAVVHRPERVVFRYVPSSGKGPTLVKAKAEDQGLLDDPVAVVGLILAAIAAVLLYFRRKRERAAA